MDKQIFLNTKVSNLTMDESLKLVENLILNKNKSEIAFINTDVVMKIENDCELKKAIDKSDIVLVDGKPLMWISKIKKYGIKEKVSGSDFVPKVCELSNKNGYSIFILGGKYGVAEQAKINLQNKYKNLNIVGTYAPKIGFEKDLLEINKINNLISKNKPDILIVCLGCPKQEKWVSENIDKYNACITICAGATVDFLAGNIKRAPKWMSNCGLEWFYRFLQEPKRLFKRYFIDDVKILKLIKKYR